MRQAYKPFTFKTRRQWLALAVAACFASGAQALPTAPTVVNGSASFATSGNTLNVTNSNGAIINWQSFGIAAGETTRFIQASASSRVLNQVVGVNGVAQMSQIYGTLSSNGQVWLVNTAGIMVGAGGVVDTAGFVASTLKIRPEDFLANQLKFQATPGAGNVVNQGEIRTPGGGFAYLIGSNVSNEGIIATPNGETILAAGATVNLIDTATPGVKVEITGAANNATNLGEIVAEAGRIGIAGTIVRNSGTLNASSVVNEGGRIFLKASQDTYVDGNGRIVATGTKGGQVEVLGNRVAVMDNAEIDASGANGGGTILVGGDYQGKNPDIQNASITYFGPNASLKANATDTGNGGKVIVWADDTARAFGSIEARGGPNGGNGGFVETSGHRHLDINGIRVRTGGGTWLLDPYDIQITNSGSSLISSACYGGECTFAPSGTPSTVYGFSIYSNLNSGNNVTVAADGSITVSESIYWTTAKSLTLAAGENIVVNAAITGNNAGSILIMLAGGSITQNATVSAGQVISLADYANYSAGGAGTTVATGSLVNQINNSTNIVTINNNILPIIAPGAPVTPGESVGGGEGEFGGLSGTGGGSGAGKKKARQCRGA